MSNEFRRGDKVAVKFDALVVVQSVDGDTVTVTHPAYEVGSPLVVPADRVSLLERPLPNAVGTLIRVNKWTGEMAVEDPQWVALRHQDGWFFAIDRNVTYTDEELLADCGSDFTVIYDPTEAS